jgi:phosphoribosylglycinamide formyltransferase-1
MLVPKDGNKIDWAKLTALLRQHRITHIVLAGFMKIVPKSFVAEWRGHLVNLHPSLLPSYPGLDSISRAIQDGAPLGATVHEVDEGVDSGRVICMRKTVPVDSGFSPWFREFLVHVDEQRLLPFVVRSF